VGVAKKDVTVAMINEALISVSQGKLKNILACESAELVSVDYKGHPASSIVDLASTMVLGTRMFKVLSWYDNEAGFSNRMVDMALFLQSKGL
jgi:glyceraldehyde 3-phosphate dehydrogenase